ncbi:MAG: ABC transporter substrate-binding protein [Prolixibacteraceae bacterium]|nr:ABC transporter substrate-binding protein [Prolixibacteraceae bacterium]
MKQILLLILIAVFFYSCGNKKNTTSSSGNNTNDFARGFQISKAREVTKLTVYNPWEKAQNVKVEYFLINKNREIPDSLQSKNTIQTPVERIICLSTSHLGFIGVLGENQSVVGVSGAGYVSGEEIQERIAAGKVVDVGYGQNLNYEMILNQHPDLVMLYGVGGEVTSLVKKLEELGIPAIMNAEYLEETPLGKAEWIKFAGALYEKENEATQFFNRIKKDYLSLKEKVKEKENKPKVLVGSPYKDSWWIPGGNSYMANLIKDAGGDYIGKNNSSHESYVISFENALAYGNEADVWINMGLLSSKKEIVAADQRFESFKVLKEGRVFNNNNKMGKKGGNDFWESGTVYPNLILRDLISVFYPGTIEDEMIYYREVK